VGSLSRLLTQTIELASPGTLDVHGTRTPGSYTGYTGRVVDRQRLSRDKEGREVVSQRQAFIFADIPDLTPEWHVRLPTGYTPRTPPIIECRRIGTKRGFHHMEIRV
jgi:hypothetical protein